MIRAHCPIFRYVIAVFAGVLACLVAATARADRLSLVPVLSTWWEYSDNLLLTPEESDDEKLADHSINVQPGLAVIYDSLRTQARIGGTTAFQWYLEETQENGIPDLVNADAGVSYWITPKTRLAAGEMMTFYYDPRDAQGTAAQEILQARTGSIGNTINLGAEQIFTGRSSMRLDYRFITNEFEDLDLFDVVSHQIEADWRERVSERHTVVIFGRYTRNLYSHEFDFVRRLYESDARMEREFPYQIDRESDFDTYVPGLGLDYQLTATLQFQARSGMILPARWIDDKDYELDPIDWYQRLAATHTWRFLRTTASYTRDLTPANGLESAVLAQDYALALQQVWTRHWQTGQELGFNRATQSAGEVDAWRQAVNANYYFFGWLGVGAGYQHFEQFTDFGIFGAHTITNRFLATLTITTPSVNTLSVTP